jgi:hypothetical protein
MLDKRQEEQSMNTDTTNNSLKCPYWKVCPHFSLEKNQCTRNCGYIYFKPCQNIDLINTSKIAKRGKSAIVVPLAIKIKRFVKEMK